MPSRADRWTSSQCQPGSGESPVVMLRLACSALLLLGCLPAVAQVTVQNPKKIAVSEARVAVIYDVVRKLVFEEIKPAGGKPLNMKLTLSLAMRPDSGHLTNEDESTAEIFMTSWDEPRFAYLVMGLCLQEALPKKRRLELLKEARRRVDLLAPVDLSRLKKQKVVVGPLVPDVITGPDPLPRCSGDEFPQPPECRRALVPAQSNPTPNRRDR